MDNRSPSMLKSTLIGGGGAGILGGLPIIGACCCLWMIGGGMLSAFLYSRECVAARIPFGAGSGGLVGLISALFYAIVSSVLGTLTQLAMGVTAEEGINQMLDAMEDSGMEPEMIDSIGRMAEAFARPGFALVIGFFVTLLAGAILASIGGLIGGAIFKHEPPPPPSQSTYDVPPQPDGPQAP